MNLHSPAVGEKMDKPEWRPAFLDQIGLGVILVNEEGVASYINEKATQLLGVSIEKLSGAGLLSLRRERFSHLFSTYYDKACSTGDPVKFEEMLPPPASVSRLKYSLYPTGSGMLITIEDVSAEWRANEGLRAAALSINKLPDAIFMVQEDGMIFHSNETARRVVGYDRDELNDMAIGNLLPGIDFAALKGDGTPDSCTRELTLKEKSGKTLPVEVIVIRTVFYNRMQYVVTARDITKRKRVEESLRETRDYLESLLDHANAPIIVWDPAFLITRFNRAFEQLSGYTAAEVVGNNLEMLFLPDSIGDSLEKIRSTLAGERWESVEIPILRKDGGVRIALWNSANVYGINGELQATIAQGQDITERKQAEREVGEARARAELYLDLMGHDINNMNQIAIGYLEMARELQKDEAGREFIDKPAEVLQRCTRLIQNVRKLQKLQDGALQTGLVDVCEVLADVQREYGDVPHKSVTLDMSDCEHCRVRANELLHDVFANMVGNAIKHTGDQADIVIVMDMVDDSGTRCCRVAVEDDGPGVPDWVKDRLFMRFHRGDTQTHGKGLGLYLVKSLVESYGGRVWVEDSVQGDYAKGARFVVMLPLAD
jgi:PAS domain S-box/PAS domain S-box